MSEIISLSTVLRATRQLMWRVGQSEEAMKQLTAEVKALREEIVSLKNEQKPYMEDDGK